MREDEAMAPCEIDHRLGRGDAEFFRLMISLAGVLLVAPHRGWAELRSTGRTNASAPTHTKPNASLLRAAYPYTYGEHQHSSYNYLKRCRQEWSIHVAVSDPRDSRQFQSNDDHRGYERHM